MKYVFFPMVYAKEAPERVKLHPLTFTGIRLASKWYFQKKKQGHEAVIVLTAGIYPRQYICLSDLAKDELIKRKIPVQNIVIRRAPHYDRASEVETFVCWLKKESSADHITIINRSEKMPRIQMLFERYCEKYDMHPPFEWFEIRSFHVKEAFREVFRVPRSLFRTWRRA